MRVAVWLLFAAHGGAAGRDARWLLLWDPGKTQGLSTAAQV
jgi:hypothetical protein